MKGRTPTFEVEIFEVKIFSFGLLGETKFTPSTLYYKTRERDCLPLSLLFCSYFVC